MMSSSRNFSTVTIASCALQRFYECSKNLAPTERDTSERPADRRRNRVSSALFADAALFGPYFWPCQPVCLAERAAREHQGQRRLSNRNAIDSFFLGIMDETCLGMSKIGFSATSPQSPRRPRRSKCSPVTHSRLSSKEPKSSALLGIDGRISLAALPNYFNPNSQ